MNRAQLTAQIAEKAGLSKNQAGKLLNTVFGRFYIKCCQARTGFNPNTKERIEIEAHDKIAFKASDNMAIYSRKHSAE